nr:uncharacterized protein LOC109186796 [Ipomoea trifida]
MEGSVSAAEDLGAPPESWEVADLDASVRRLMLSSSNDSSAQCDLADSSSASAPNSESASSSSAPASGVPEDVVNSVDQFLREALQNPRERLSVLRMEQDVEKFIKDPTQQQMEFQQLPTSYLRLAAHRVAQHYSLQSTVLVDSGVPDGSASRIIVRKTSECRLPSIRLADIPVTFPQDDAGAIKVAIKQRPQKSSQAGGSSGSHSQKNRTPKSVEERKEEYNRARARIFNSNNLGRDANEKPENETRRLDTFQHISLGMSGIEDKTNLTGGSDVNIGRGSLDLSLGSGRSVRGRSDKEPISRTKTGNRVAIFRDREIDLKDPDYDRSYDRYIQRFDPGFGFSGGPYGIQPMYAPAVNYNTEFPQLGSAHRPVISTEHPSHQLPQHLPGPWATPSTPGIGYVPTETMIPPFGPNHVVMHSNSALYLHSAQYPRQHPGMPFIHHHEQVQGHPPFSQSHQQLLERNFGLARPQ